VGRGKSGVLEHKSDNISETRKDRGKVTIEGLWELTKALSDVTIPDHPTVRNLYPKFQSKIAGKTIAHRVMVCTECL